MSTYKTIISNPEGIFRDRGSKFLAYAFGVRSREEVSEHLELIRSNHPKARHHCYAYRIGIDGQDYRANDDGEPSGSAGMPILNVLQSYDLTNTLLIVVRYFGGTKLGIPGLINAYKQAGMDALNQAKIVEKHPIDTFLVTVTYKWMPAILDALKHVNLDPIDKEFTDTGMRARIAVRKDGHDTFYQACSSAIEVPYEVFDLDNLPSGFEISILEEEI